MPRLALSPTGGYYADPNRHWSAQDCVNYLPMKAERAGTRTPDQLRQCPGLRPFAPNLGGALRGLHNVEGKLFAVGGSSLYRIKSDVVIPYGTVPGTARVSMAHNAANELLTVNGSAGYLFNTASLAFAKVTDEGYPGASVVGFVDQYFPQVAPNGAYWFWSDLSNGAAYNTLDRAEAEADPDRVVTLFVSHREVLVFGRDTIEPFINTGAATGTFQRAANTVIECGCAARFSVAGMDNAVFFLDDKRVVRVLRGVTPERVSTAGIEQALGECTAEEISRAFAFTWEDRGHKVYYLTVPGRFTFGFDLLSGEWHRRLSPGLNTWRITSLVFWEGQWVGGDDQGRLYVLDWDYFYDGREELIRRGRSGVLHADQRRMTLNRLEMLFGVGGPACELEDWPDQPEGPTLVGGPPDGLVGEEYSHTFTATGGTPPYSFSHRSGTLPPAAEQETDGELAGTLTTAGTYSDNVFRVTDANGLWDDATHDIVVREPTVVWTAGEDIGQKYSGGVGVTQFFQNSDVGDTHRSLQAHRASGRVFLPTFTAIYVYESGLPAAAIATPTEIAFTQTMAQVTPYQTALDQETGTFAVVGGSTDKALIVFDDNSTEEIDFGADTSPTMVSGLGDGKFAFWCLETGLLHVYGPVNDYASALVTSGAAVMGAISMTADPDGSRVFISSDDSEDIRIVNTATGAVTSVSSGGRTGYRLVYHAGLDRLVMDNMDNGADNGKLFVIDPAMGVVDTLDYSGAYPGSTFKANSFKDMVLCGDTVTALCEFTNGAAEDYGAALMIDIAAGTIINEYAFAVADSPDSLASNDRDGVVYIGISNWDQVPYLTTAPPYSTYPTIDGWLSADNTWVTWL